MATKSASKKTASQLEETYNQVLLLLMAAKNYSQSNYPIRIKNCKTMDEKFYVRRENQRITDFLSSMVLWLSEKHWDQKEKSGNGGDGQNAGDAGDLPFYYPERTDLDHLLTSEFIGIRFKVEQFNDRLNGVMRLAA